MRNADAAMYKAKRAGKARYVVFETKATLRGSTGSTSGTPIWRSGVRTSAAPVIPAIGTARVTVLLRWRSGRTDEPGALAFERQRPPRSARSAADGCRTATEALPEGRGRRG